MFGGPPDSSNPFKGSGLFPSGDLDQKRRPFPGSPRLFARHNRDLPTSLFGMPPIHNLANSPPVGSPTLSLFVNKSLEAPGFSFSKANTFLQNPQSVQTTADEEPPTSNKESAKSIPFSIRQTVVDNSSTSDTFHNLSAGKGNPFVSNTPLGTNIFSPASVAQNLFKPKEKEIFSPLPTTSVNIFASSKSSATSISFAGVSKPIPLFSSTSPPINSIKSEASPMPATFVSSQPYKTTSSKKVEPMASPFKSTNTNVNPFGRSRETPGTTNVFAKSSKSSTFTFKPSTTASLFSQTAQENTASGIFTKSSPNKPTKSIFSRLTPRSSVTPVFSKPPDPSRSAATSSNVFTQPAVLTQSKVILPLKKKDPRKPRQSRVEEHNKVEEVKSLVVDEQELLQIMGKRADTDQDRYDVLEARDKLMKAKGLHKKSTILQGTCPDMCPEKERYSRLVKNQLRFYEKLDGEINPKATVKEYSRSSADQDVPLSHELRPAKVLKQTMDHILCNVIDRVDNIGGSLSQWYQGVQAGVYVFANHGGTSESENIGDWFEFVWNTTRAIRKDLTQQQLSDIIAVSLVEKCARFHIVCSERLVEEDSNNFSRKLNDENLTKCLQTLKHMYEDLKHEDVKCPNEPEFRSYEVLMNLNDGDILRSILTLDKWVRETTDVKLSVNVFMALNSNNYVRFFKLVRQATLLQGCILLRYFYQIRKLALETIIRANCPTSKNIVPFSLTKLSFLLGFEDVQSCGLCCRLHGLDYEGNSDTIYLSRGSYYEPSELPDLARARNLIESKRTVPWSEVINGSPLEQNPYNDYVPHDSFNENHYLCHEAYNAADQVSEKVPMSPEDCLRHDQKLQRQRSINASTHELATEILNDLIEDQSRDVARQTIAHFDLMDCAVLFSKEMSEQVIDSMINEVGAKVMREAKNMELEQRIRHEIKMDAAEEVAELILMELVDKMCGKLAKEKMVSVEKDMRLKVYLKVAADVIEDMCGDQVSEDAGIFALQAIKQAEDERKRRIDELQRGHDFRLLKTVFKKWHSIVVKHNQMASMLQMFPSCPSTLSARDQNQKFGSRQALSTWGGRDSQRKTEKLLTAIDISDGLMHKLIIEPLDVAELVASKLSVRCGELMTNLTWKCLLCLPVIEENSPQKVICEVIRKKFTKVHARSKSDPNLVCCFTCIHKFQSFSACVRCIDNEVLDEEIAMSEKKRRELLAGASAIMFLYLHDDESVESARQRLGKLISHIFRRPPIPLYILSTASDTDKTLAELQVEDFLQEGFLSSIDISYIPSTIFDLALMREIGNATSVLAEKSPANLVISGLQHRSIRDFVEDFICIYVLGEFYMNLRDRKLKRLPDQDPSTLVSLFNAAIQHLKQVCLRRELMETSWPIPELQPAQHGSLPSYWNDPMYTDMVVESLDSLLLPEPLEIPDAAGSTWADQVNAVFKYCDGIQNGYADYSQCTTRIRKCLMKAYRAFERQSCLKQDALPFIPWTDIVHAFIDYKIAMLPTVDKFSPTQESIVVAFYQCDFDNFKFPKSWKTGLGWVPENKATISLESSFAARKSFCASLSPENCLASIRQELNESNTFEDKLCLALASSMQEENSIPDFEDSVVKLPNVTRYYAPTISLLSPSLGKLATPRSALLTFTNVRSEDMYDEERMEERPILAAMKRKAMKSYDNSLPKKPASSDVQYLQIQMEDDLNASHDFEQMLKNALSK